MLQLEQVTKRYKIGETTIGALNGINLTFQKAEFVTILGPSGCGKTTLLNIIGGLDRYSGGDLIINGQSTKLFNNHDWDNYRNKIIGFVFQSYHLISHLSVLDNVALSLALSGLPIKERQEKALAVLSQVGLADQASKRPRQLSGGQMQRVAIARALVNDPDIILADEPTGALDSKTSVQVMDLLKQISKDRLVMMVTHNHELANHYADRQIKMLDGLIVDDQVHQAGIDLVKKEKREKKSTLPFHSALGLSFRNLFAKKARSIITSLAASIGIVGVGLVLAIKGGMNDYIKERERTTLAGYPIIIQQTVRDANYGSKGSNAERVEFPETKEIYSYDPSVRDHDWHNNISTDYVEHITNHRRLHPELYNRISYSRGLNIHAFTKTDANTYKDIGNSSYFNELPADEELLSGQYDFLTGHFPEKETEIVLVIDKYSRISINMINNFGLFLDQKYTFDDFLNREIHVIENDDYYYLDEDTQLFDHLTASATAKLSTKMTLSIVGIMRLKEDAVSDLLGSGYFYTSRLTDQLLSSASTSAIALAQEGLDYSVLTGQTFNEYVTYQETARQIGLDTSPVGIYIYPSDFESKVAIKQHLNAWNEAHPGEDKIIYTDRSEAIVENFATILNTVSFILICFAAISLCVSTIMIGIITYVSVVERTKEIGVLRALGARRKDIALIFICETILVGFFAGLLGVSLTYLLSGPINVWIGHIVEIKTVAALPTYLALVLILGSSLLTALGGLLPAYSASRKDPVIALSSNL